MVLASGPLIDAEDLPASVRGLAGAAATERAAAIEHRPLNRSLAELEKSHIAETLVACGGNVSETARVLGIDRSTLYHKMKRYQIEREAER